MSQKKLDIYSAIITPLKKDLSLDQDSLKELLNQHVQHQVGVVLLGSTGEGLNLPASMRNEILNIALKTKDLHFILNLGGHDLESMLSLMEKTSHEKMIKGYMLTTPYYARPGDHGQFQWFHKLLQHSNKDCMLYDVPSRTGTSLSLAALLKLKSHPKFKWLKNASANDDKTRAYHQVLRDQSILSGDDPYFREHLRLGANGIVSVLSQAHLELASALMHDPQNDDLWKKWQSASSSLSPHPNPVGIKALLHHQGKIKTPYLYPPLHHLDQGAPYAF